MTVKNATRHVLTVERPEARLDFMFPPCLPVHMLHTHSLETTLYQKDTEKRQGARDPFKEPLPSPHTA